MIATETFAHEAGSVTRARRLVTRVLAALPQESRDMVEIMVSELASNAVRHTGSGFTVLLDVSASRVRVEVSDSGEGRPVLRSPDPSESSGRGLHIVNLLADEWGVSDSGDGSGKTIWFNLSAARRREGLSEKGAGPAMAPTPPGLEQLVRHLPQASLIVGEDLRVSAASAATERIFDAGIDALLGLPITRLLPDNAVVEAVRSALGPDATSSSRVPFEARAARLDGRNVDVEVVVRPALGLGAPRSAVVSFREAALPLPIEEHEDVWVYLDIAIRLAVHISSAADEREALSCILPMLLEELGWDVACLWLVSTDQRHLVCTATSPNNYGPTQDFEDVSRKLRPVMGQGIPGSTWSSRRPLLANVGVGDASLLRQDVIRRAGLNVAVAFPLVAEGEVIGVIEMHASRHSSSIPLRLLEGLEQIGRQTGQLIAHVRAESKLREEQRLSSFLLEAATVLSGSSDYRDALSRLASIAVPAMADLCLIDVRQPDASIARMAAVHASPEKARLVGMLKNVYAPLPDSRHPAVEVMRTGVSSWSSEMPERYIKETTRDERHFDVVKQLGFESYMCVPLRDGDEVLGAITLVSAGSGRRFGPEDLALPEELADRAANLIAAARRHERERQLAQQLQRLLLPESLPDIRGFEVCVRYTAGAPDAYTGGDFYDVMKLADHGIGMLIGDVEGHDAVAAATMGQLRSASRALSASVSLPSQLLQSLRSSWGLLGFRRLATLLVAWLDPHDGTVTMASAGHLPPAYLPPEGGARLLPVAPGPPLGLSAPPATDRVFTLDEGGTLLLYTDGLVEQREALLDDRLQSLLRTLESLIDGGPLDDLCHHVMCDLAPDLDNLRDDVALLAIRRQPE
jgi:serine phosphatase RsbU (regulator of sigma subunit)/anti-sigma regulatory factor (Ser/Thr protein kinase)